MKNFLFISLLVLIFETAALFHQLRIIEIYNINKIDWVAISAIALIATIYFIFQQTKATKEMEKNQRIPAVEVYMRHDGSEGTYFEFCNFSNMPAFVSIDIIFYFQGKRVDDQHIGSGKRRHYRIGPKVSTHTASTFFGKEKNKIIHKPETHAELQISVKNALSNDQNIGMTYSKEYIFKDDIYGKRWDEETWGFPELPPKNT